MAGLKEVMEAAGLIYNPELAKINKVNEEIARMLGLEKEYNQQKQMCKIDAFASFNGI